VATLKPRTEEEAAAVPAVKAEFDDLRFIRKSDFVNNIWRALTNQPAVLERTWASIKLVMIEPKGLVPRERRSGGDGCRLAQRGWSACN
jgi:alkylhydroperoxidase family enzyme